LFFYVIKSLFQLINTLV